MIIKGDELMDLACQSSLMYNSCMQTSQEGLSQILCKVQTSIKQAQF